MFCFQISKLKVNVQISKLPDYFQTVKGGGQPQVHADVRNFEDVKAIRAKVLYDNDAAKTLRKSPGCR